MTRYLPLDVTKEQTMNVTFAATPLTRDPSPDILQWDNMGCEAACTAQLLYMHHRLDLPFDTATFDRRVGRRSGEADLTGGCLKVLLEEGFEVHSIHAVDATRFIVDPAYVRDLWIKDGDSPEEVDAYFPTIYPQARARCLGRLAVLSDHPGCHEEIARDSSWDDVPALLNQGYCVVAYIYLPTRGSCHQVLVVRESELGWFEVYDPDEGLVLMHGESELAPRLLSGLEGYHLRRRVNESWSGMVDDATR